MPEETAELGTTKKMPSTERAGGQEANKNRRADSIKKDLQNEMNLADDSLKAFVPTEEQERDYRELFGRVNRVPGGESQGEFGPKTLSATILKPRVKEYPNDPVAERVSKSVGKERTIVEVSYSPTPNVEKNMFFVMSDGMAKKMEDFVASKEDPNEIFVLAYDTYRDAKNNEGKPIIQPLVKPHFEETYLTTERKPTSDNPIPVKREIIKPNIPEDYTRVIPTVKNNKKDEPGLVPVTSPVQIGGVENGSFVRVGVGGGKDGSNSEEKKNSNDVPLVEGEWLDEDEVPRSTKSKNNEKESGTGEEFVYPDDDFEEETKEKGSKTEKEKGDTFEDLINGLLNGKEGKAPDINNDRLRRIAATALKKRNRNFEAFDQFLKDGDKLYMDGVVDEEEWEKLASVLDDEKDRLDPKKAKAEKETPPPPSGQSGEIPKVEVVNKLERPKDESAEGWIKFIFAKIEKAESLSENIKDQTKATDAWTELENYKDLIPGDIGFKYIPDSEEAQNHFIKYKDGLRLKDRLSIYILARKNLQARYVQVKEAKGDLRNLGVGGEATAGTTLGKDFQELTPENMWAIIHSDDLFAQDIAKATAQERKEILPDIDAGLSLWWDVGRLYDRLPTSLLTPDEKKVVEKIKTHTGSNRWPPIKDIAKNLSAYGINANEFEVFYSIPVYSYAISTDESRNVLKDRMVAYLGSEKAVDLADKLFACWLTHAMLDKGRSGQGKGEDRDLMYFDTKRKIDFSDKLRPVLPPWSVGRFWGKQKQEEVISLEKARKDPILARRREMLEINRKRPVFDVPEGWYEGELIGDFLHTNIKYRDPNTQDIVFRKLITYAIDTKGRPVKNGWKAIPFFVTGEKAYSTFFDTFLGIANKISDTITTPAKIEELKDQNWWAARRNTFENNLPLVCPWLNSNWRSASEARSDDEIKRYKEDRIMDFKMVDVAGLLSLGSLYVKEGLNGILGGIFIESTFGHEDVNQIMKAIEASGYLNQEYLAYLGYELKEMGYGDRWWRKFPGLNWATDKRYNPPDTP